MSKRYWRIRGYDGLTQIFERKVAVGQITESRIQELLKVLVAKAGLTSDEIIGAYAKRRTEIANEFLRVQKDGPYPSYSCGSNPTFTADVVDETGKPVRPDL